MDHAMREYLGRRRTKHRPNMKARLAMIGAGFGAVCAMTSAFLFAVVLFFYQSTAAAYAPIGEEISLRGTGITTVYDRTGEPLGVLTNPNSAIAAPIPLEEISAHMVAATISTEDNNYWDHKGFDVKGLFRAAWNNYVKDQETTGGSTITQQLVKTTYFTTDCEEIDGITQCTAPRTVDRKMKEVVLAVETESKYSKEQILSWYLNSISYSGRYVGVESAARGYFDKPASDLTLAEAALLAGIPSAPTRYHPRTNCVTAETGACITDEQGRTTLGGEAKARQEYVLDLMAAHGHITPAQAEEAKAEQVLISARAADARSQAFIDNQVEPRLVRMCQAGVLPLLDGADDCIESVHQAGYKVTSSLNWQMTQEASSLLNQYITAGLAAGCGCHNGSIVTIEPASGQVVVYVPNIDPTWTSDPRVAGNIDQAADVHQPGSSFKPAVYLTWMDKLNKTPMSSIWDTNPLKLVDRPSHPDEQVEIINPGRAGSSQGLITARAALGGSQNVPAFRAAQEAGVDNVIAMAKALGITTLEQFFDPTFRSHDSVYYGPAIATGGANIRAIDMAYMNSTISNMGVMVGVPTYASTFDPKDAISVEGAEGDVLERALNQRAAFLNGYLRLPGTRELDPVVVLKVEGANGEVLYEHGEDLVRKPVVDAGSVWMLHSIMSDCEARFIIWQCGTSNGDLSLDFFMEGGVKIPGGVKTGTQQGVTAKDTLETWMTGYSRYAATAVWVGNADKTPVRDGPEANYASANATVRLFKTWMGAYHTGLQSIGMFETPAGFEELQPGNVKFGPFQSATTERGRGGGCRTMVNGWQRTDIDYQGGDCKSRSCFELPEFKRELAVSLAYSRRIPACGISIAPAATPAPQQPAPNAQPPRQAPGNQQPPNQGNPPPAQANPPQGNPPPNQNPPNQNPPNQNPGNQPGNGNNGNGNGNGNGNNDRGGDDEDD